MKVTTTTRIGGVDITFEVEHADDKEALLRAVGLATPKTTCNICGDMGLESKSLTSYRTADGLVYISIRCACGAKSDLGTYRAGGNFWKDFEMFEGNGQQAQPARQTTPEPRPEPISADTVKAIAGLLESRGVTPEQSKARLQELFGVDRLRDLTAEQGAKLQRTLSGT